MIRPIVLLLVLSLSSCGLIQMPFRVAGGVTRGTARAVSKPIEAHKLRKEEKERQQAKEEAKRQKEEAATKRPEPDAELPLPSNDGFPDLESIEPDLPPLPSEYRDPQGE